MRGAFGREELGAPCAPSRPGFVAGGTEGRGGAWGQGPRRSASPLAGGGLRGPSVISPCRSDPVRRPRGSRDKCSKEATEAREDRSLAM